jgi:hypothetical protein
LYPRYKKPGLWIRIRIRIRIGSGFKVTLRIRIRIGNPDPDPGARKLRNFSGKIHFLFIFKNLLPLTLLFEKIFDE